MNPKDPGQSNAALMTTFAAAGWLAIMIHAAAVEAFIWLTPAETERLRKISYQRQLARKYKNPGSAGAVAQRLGDADEGSPPAQKDSGTDERCENESKV